MDVQNTTTIAVFIAIGVCPILYIVLTLVGEKYFPVQYRIVTNGRGYKVQYKTKFWPCWDDCFYSYCNTKEEAKEYIKIRIAAELKQKQENTWVRVDEN